MEPSLKKELLRMVLMILITKVSRALVRQVFHLYMYNNPDPWDNTGLEDVEVGLDGNLTVLSKHIQIVVWVDHDMLGVGKWNTSCMWLIIIVFVTFVCLTDAYTTFELSCQAWYFESVPWLLFFQLEGLLEEDNHNQEAQRAPLNSLGWDLHKLGRQKVVNI